jgi:hypothetical protein
VEARANEGDHNNRGQWLEIGVVDSPHECLKDRVENVNRRCGSTLTAGRFASIIDSKSRISLYGSIFA